MEKQTEKLKNYLREKDGTVSAEKMNAELEDIFEAQKRLKKIVILASMLKTDEDSVICDLAETYQIYNYRELPPEMVAFFCDGLREDSRIKLKMSGQRVGVDTLLLASAVDRLSALVWAKTKDGQKGINKPKSLVDSLTHQTREKEELVFSSGEDFEKMRNEILNERRTINGD